MAVDHFYKFGVDSVGKDNVVFKLRTHRGDVQIFDVVHIYYRVGISHGHCCDVIYRAADLKRRVDHLLRIRHNGNLSGGEDGSSHVYFYLTYFPLCHRKLQILDPASCGHADIFLFHDPVVIDVFCHTADSVAAHGALGPVHIVHIHLAVGDIRRFDQDQPVGSDTEMAVADKLCHSGRIRHVFLKTVYIYIIVADAVHFCKFHHIPPQIIYTPCMALPAAALCAVRCCQQSPVYR